MWILIIRSDIRSRDHRALVMGILFLEILSLCWTSTLLICLSSALENITSTVTYAVIVDVKSSYRRLRVCSHLAYIRHHIEAEWHIFASVNWVTIRSGHGLSLMWRQSISLNQWWLIDNWTLRNELQWKLNRNVSIFIHENAALKLAVCKMSAILFQLFTIMKRLYQFIRAICSSMQ